MHRFRCNRTRAFGRSAPTLRIPTCCSPGPSMATCSAASTGAIAGAKNGASSPKSRTSRGCLPFRRKRKLAMAIPKIRRVAHVVLYVRDPEKSARWYSEVLGMQVSARVPDGPYRGGVFLSFGEHDHDLALFPTSHTQRGQEFEHIGLEVACDGDLEPLRRLYGSMLRHNVKIHEVLDHGVSIGIYFFDPD